MPRAATLAAAAALAAALVAAPFSARAFGPHETALVINDASVDSIVLGAVWARLHSVPPSNIVRVSVPGGPDGAVPETISRADFESLIYGPASRELDARDAPGQIMAWTYSCGFPVRVVEEGQPVDHSATNALSLTGATFLRGRIPEQDEVVRASYSSPLYAGPGATLRHSGTNETIEVDGVAGAALSLDRRRNELLDRMPLPAFMLGYTGPRGTALAEAVAALERSAAANGTCPTGSVLFVRNEGDVRDGARAWQYAGVSEFLAALGRGVIAEELPSDEDAAAFEGPVVGYMTGAVSVRAEPKLLPGAYADHFTSYAAAFDSPTQMKATRWLRSGAAFSSGQVCEPFSIWNKFPTAWIFPRLVSGATALEAFYASVSCPLQVLPIGDPLCAPWAPVVKPEIEVEGDAEEPFGSAVHLRAKVSVSSGSGTVRFLWYVDDRFAGTGPALLWDAGAEETGEHVVRLVARLQDMKERPQGFVVQSFATTAKEDRRK